jgi:uncharacterized protein (TIGR03083 family)
MSDTLPALHASVDRLAALVSALGDDATRSAYPTEWTVADVVSHLGSGAVIWTRLLDDQVAGTATPEDFNQQVWAEWDAKSPRAKLDHGLAADAALTARMESTSAEDRSRVLVEMGPMQLDWGSLIGMRLSEHLLHEWDVAVALDPAATLADDGTAFVVDRLEMIARYAAKPAGPHRTITVATTAPARGFRIEVGDEVTITAIDPPADPTLALPAEAYVRLAYGRLDADHTPASVTGDPDALEQLRAVFPGI